MKNQENNLNINRELIHLVEQSIWANHEWIDFVYSQADIETRPHQLLCHIIAAERIWFGRISKDEKAEAAFPQLNKEELLQSLKENHETFLKLIAGRPEDMIHFTRATGETYHARVIDIIYHLLTHGYHHRGQLASHYARKGVTYPNTDHINFLLVNEL